MKNQTKNVAAFEKLLRICDKTGASYHPGNPSIESTALKGLLDEAQKKVQAVHVAQSDLTTIINLRIDAFRKLSNLATNVVSIAEAGGMPKEHLDDLNRIAKRFRSQPFKGAVAKAKSGNEINGAGNAASSTSTRFNRQLGFDVKVENFAQLIQFVEGKPTYVAHEPQFTIEGLKTKLAELHEHNSAVEKAKAIFNQARMKRNAVIFGSDSGIPGIVRKVKVYLRAIFGANSEQYNEVKSVRVKK